MPAIDPATARALSQRLAVEQSERRLPSVAAGLVRGGELVWSGAAGTLDDALRLLSLPRLVGVHPEDGEEITAQNGRYGPYLKKGTDSRSLTAEDQIFDITLDEALAIYAQPKQRGRAAAAAPLRDLGPDPVSGAPMLVKDGRFGPYVTDGTTNATLRKDDDVESITPERGAELLADKRARGPVAKKSAAKRPAKKAAAKKATSGTAKKATAKKTAKAGSATTTVKKAAAKKVAAKKAAAKSGVGKVAAAKAGAK